MIRLKTESGISAIFNKFGNEISKAIDKLGEIVWENMPGDCLWIKLTENTAGSVKFYYSQSTDPDYTFKLYIKTSTETEWTEIGLKHNNYYRKTFTSPDYLMIKGDVTNTLNGLEIVCENYTDYEVGGRLNALYGKLTGDNTCPENVNAPFHSLFFNSQGSITGTSNGIKYANKLKLCSDTKKACYCRLFYMNEYLEKTPKLPATTLAEKCYESMFEGCSRLTAAPELPATTLAPNCYDSMFYNCSSLNNAPKLLSQELKAGCYNSMFGNCTMLKYVKCMATSGFDSVDPLTGWLYNTASGDTGQLDIACGHTSDFDDFVATNWNINELCFTPHKFYCTRDVIALNDSSFVEDGCVYNYLESSYSGGKPDNAYIEWDYRIEDDNKLFIYQEHNGTRYYIYTKETCESLSTTVLLTTDESKVNIYATEWPNHPGEYKIYTSNNWVFNDGGGSSSCSCTTPWSHYYNIFFNSWSSYDTGNDFKIEPIE